MTSHDGKKTAGRLPETAPACVKCGSCTAACPAYRATGRESHTARGKHHLLDRLPPGERSAAFDDIFSQCLLCGACVAACPRKLDTPGLIVAVREELERHSGQSFLQHLAARAVSHPRLAASLQKAGSLARSFLLDRLPRESGLRLKLAALDPALFQPAERSFLQTRRHPEPAAESPDYFVGCYANLLHPEIGHSTDRLVGLVHGSPGRAPAGQTCCGLAFLASGDRAEAVRLAKKNIVAFEKSGERPILASCASCSSHLATYPALLAHEPDWAGRAEKFAGRLLEFSSYLAGQLPAVAVPPGNREITSSPARPNSLKIFYHDPCHLRFGPNITAPSRRIIASLPGLELAELPGGPRCCGQGGLYHMAQPDSSQAIFERLQTELLPLGVDTITTTCSGCLMQYRRLLGKRHPDISIRHLAEVICETLEREIHTG